MSTSAAPPAGFEIDPPAAGVAPPPGFELDSPAPPPGFQLDALGDSGPGPTEYQRAASRLRPAAAMAVRAGLPVAGMVAGGLTPVPGGAYAGAAAGGYLGELAAQKIEGSPTDQGAAVLEGGLAAVPFVGRGSTVVRHAALRAAEAAGLGYVGEGARQTYEQGTLHTHIDFGRVATATALGAVLGGAAGAIEARVGARARGPEEGTGGAGEAPVAAAEPTLARSIDPTDPLRGTQEVIGLSDGPAWRGADGQIHREGGSGVLDTTMSAKASKETRDRGAVVGEVYYPDGMEPPGDAVGQMRREPPDIEAIRGARSRGDSQAALSWEDALIERMGGVRAANRELSAAGLTPIGETVDVTPGAREAIESPSPPVEKAEPPPVEPPPADPAASAGGSREALGRPQLGANQIVGRLETTDDIKSFVYGEEPAKGPYGGPRPVRSQAASLAAAEGVSFTEGEIAGGTRRAFLAEEAVRAEQLVRASADDLAAKRAAAQLDNSPENVAIAGEAEVRHNAILEFTLAGEGEAARTLNILGRIRKQYASGAIKKVTFTRKVLEAWKAMLLTGPQTHIAQTSSNFTRQVTDVAETAVAAGIDVVRRAPPGERVLFREAAIKAFGLVNGTLDAMRALAGAAHIGAGAREGGPMAKAAEAFRTETSAFGATKYGEAANRYQGAIPGKLGRAVRLSFRFLTAEDEIAKDVAYQSALSARALRQAYGEGKRGAALDARAAALHEDFTLQRIALAEAHRLTFTTEFGKVGRAVQNLAHSHPIAEVVLPFTLAPGNLMKDALKSFPLTAIAMREVRADLAGPERSRVLAQMAVGSAVAGTVAYLAATDRLTGGGPTDPARRKVWLESHRPYAFKVDGEWYELSRMIEPMGSLLGIVGDYAELARDYPELPKGEVAGRLALGFSQNMLSKNMTMGLARFFAAVDGKDQNAREQFMKALAGSAIPAISSQAASAGDDLVRDTRGFVDNLKARLPVIREQVPPLRSPVTGKPIAQERLGPDFLSPIPVTPVNTDPVALELDRLGVGKTGPDRQISIGPGKREDLTAQEYDAVQRRAGKIVHRDLLEQIRDPDWRDLDDDEKRKQIDGAFERANTQARAPFKYRHASAAQRRERP